MYLTDGNGIAFLSPAIHNKREHNFEQGKPGISFTQANLPNSFGKIRTVSQEERLEVKGIKMLL